MGLNIFANIKKDKRTSQHETNTKTNKYLYKMISENNIK